MVCLVFLWFFCMWDGGVLLDSPGINQIALSLHFNRYIMQLT
jgi:hypothetical protein